jgi:hypothetical protein
MASESVLQAATLGIPDAGGTVPANGVAAAVCASHAAAAAGLPRLDLYSLRVGSARICQSTDTLADLTVRDRVCLGVFLVAVDV